MVGPVLVQRGSNCKQIIAKLQLLSPWFSCTRQDLPDDGTAPTIGLRGANKAPKETRTVSNVNESKRDIPCTAF